ncbi:Oidioi.mRNA.OKI2018_I69.XSR.g15196.t1.cds [Oikopleura dioica]|uniref:Oidioi.mRNA.OKI2018_I69.XSR.g15196.t1.cds n=1 Tax=Oikopleura dioica TaxID=34765 RepID=A0ABN7SCI9_OIKDI|nr:Oidioi.mRNA.OKI2018_I69.XSR.g15196.t1.cds [Oikopleura dioica]
MAHDHAEYQYNPVEVEYLQLEREFLILNAKFDRTSQDIDHIDQMLRELDEFSVRVRAWEAANPGFYHSDIDEGYESVFE